MLYNICLEESQAPLYAQPAHQTEEEDGETEEHGAFPIIDKVWLEKIMVVPNPTTGELRVTSYELQVTDVEVYDIYGRKQNVEFHSYGLTVLRSYGLSNLQSGIYFVKIITNAGEIVKKVVKQ